MILPSASEKNCLFNFSSWDMTPTMYRYILYAGVDSEGGGGGGVRGSKPLPPGVIQRGVA